MPRSSDEIGRERVVHDVIVVGAGSAGAAAAGRTARAGASVLLLEAGADWRSADASAALADSNPAPFVTSGEMADWSWPSLTARRSETQEPAPYWRGRGLGGSSTINGQFAVRPLPEDLDGWAADGCAGWAFADVLPLLNALEDDLDFGDRPHHGRGGPIPVWRPPAEGWSPLSHALRAAAEDRGYGWCEDVNAPDAEGAGAYPANVRDGRRVTTNDGYLEPLREDPALTIRGGTLVDRVLLEGGRAVGVRLADGAEVRARRVVLSAGVVHTPAILLRSGVGPEVELRRLGVAPVQVLPVGEQLQDHATVGFVLVPGDEVGSFDRARRHGSVMLRYSSGLAGAGRGDMMITEVADPASRGSYLNAWINQAESRGRLHLPSTDPTADPVLDLAGLQAEGDLVRMEDGVARLLDLIASAGFEGFGDPRFLDGTTDPTALDPGELRTALRALVGDVGHACGTARMGAPDDPRSVVDPDLRVLGVDGLLVADASVFPTVPRANTHLTAVLVGEQAARVLAGDLR